MKNSLVLLQFANNSIEHVTLKLTRDITSSIEKGEYMLGVFIDLSKVFETVDHRILIKNLEYCETDDIALEWFKGCLINRKQYITSKDLCQNCLYIICGVPD